MAKRSRRPNIAIRFLWKLTKAVLLLVISYLILCLLALTAYRYVTPPITGVQLQRMVEARVAGESYQRQYHPVASDAISQHLPRAVVAAEDGRFYEHRGVDWQAVHEARTEFQQGARMRGASTITQQLIKNLFFTTHRLYIRKAFEIPLAYGAEVILPKDRILFLYLTVVEWGPAVFGAEAASRHHFGISAAELTRRQSAGLAACLPAPRTRTPQVMTRYTGIIERRMEQHGW